MSTDSLRHKAGFYLTEQIYHSTLALAGESNTQSPRHLMNRGHSRKGVDHAASCLSSRHTVLLDQSAGRPAGRVSDWAVDGV